MTNPDDDLEARLRSRPTPPLPPSLRDRVMAEVSRRTTVATPEGVSWTRFAVGLAASLLVGLNLAVLAADSPARSPWPAPLSVWPMVSPEPIHSPEPGAGSPWLPIDLAGTGHP